MASVIDLRDDSDRDHRVPLAMVYGGGGAVGIAWHLAVIEALEDHGLQPRSAPAIGTSAGSWAACAAPLGMTFGDFEHLDALELPNREPGVLKDITSSVFGADTTLPNVRISAVALPSMRRRLLDASRYPVADLIAASSSVPGLFSAHPISGRRHVDGGVRSMASADAARPARLLIASLPIAGPLFGPIGRTFESTTRRALGRWRAAHRGTTMVLRPGRDFANAVGNSPGSMMDVELAKSVYPIAYETASRRLSKRLSELPAAFLGPSTHGLSVS